MCLPFSRKRGSGELSILWCLCLFWGPERGVRQSAPEVLRRFSRGSINGLEVFRVQGLGFEV